jgi:tetratricopeptide (TPR) repeat protein
MAEEQHDYRFAAFISYRHREPDHTWARWLHKALETYRVPKKLAAQRGLPRRLEKVFRDEEELPAAASLSDKIEQALVDARYLIVICSPQTPPSQWVNEEIGRFRQMGRDDRLLALMIEGNPEESFPENLKKVTRQVDDGQGGTQEVVEHVEPLAADVRGGPQDTPRRARELARLRLLAVILGVDFDDLRQREALRRRRRLITAGATAAGVLLALGSASGFAVYQAQRAEQAQQQAEEASGVAVDTIESMLDSKQQLEHKAGTRDTQASMLESALDKLKNIKSDLGETQRAVARRAAYVRLERGTLYLLEGNTESAGNNYEEALATLQELAEAHPEDPAIQRDLGLAWHLLGKLAERRGETHTAAERFQKALGVRERLMENHPENVGARRDLAQSYEFLGHTAATMGDTEQALTYHQRSLKLREAVREQRPEQRAARRELSDSLSNIGDMQLRLGSPNKAAAQYDRSLTLFNKLYESQPQNTEAQRNLSVALSKLGALNLRRGKPAAAQQYFQKALELIRRLVASDPEHTEWQRALSRCRTNLGYALEQQGELKEALETYQKAQQTAQKLVEQVPDRADAKKHLADAHQMIGSLLRRGGKPKEALNPLRRALEIRSTLAEAAPEDAGLKRALSKSHQRLGNAHRALNQTEKARAHLQKTADLRRALFEKEQTAQSRRDLSVALLHLARASPPGPSLEPLEEAIELRRKRLEQENPGPDDRRAVAKAYYLLGTTLRRLEHGDQALRSFEKAQNLLAAVVEARSDYAAAHKELAMTTKALGELLAAEGRTDKAAEVLDKAVQLWARQEGTDAAIQLANTRVQLGDALAQKKEFEKARGQYEIARKLLNRLAEAGHLSTAQKEKWIKAIDAKAGKIERKAI